MLYFTILWISSALALTSAQNDCALGEDYWCRSIRNAKACNAMKKCLDVWSKSPENEFQVALCMSCRRVVSDLITLYDNEEIIQGMCDVFKHANERTGCHEEVRRWTQGDLEENIAGMACAKLLSCKLPKDDENQHEAKLVRGLKRKRSLDTIFKRTGDLFHWLSSMTGKLEDSQISIAARNLETIKKI